MFSLFRKKVPKWNLDALCQKHESSISTPMLMVVVIPIAERGQIPLVNQQIISNVSQILWALVAEHWSVRLSCCFQPSDNMPEKLWTENWLRYFLQCQRDGFFSPLINELCFIFVFVLGLKSSSFWLKSDAADGSFDLNEGQGHFWIFDAPFTFSPPHLHPQVGLSQRYITYKSIETQPKVSSVWEWYRINVSVNCSLLPDRRNSWTDSAGGGAGSQGSFQLKQIKTRAKPDEPLTVPAWKWTNNALPFSCISIKLFPKLSSILMFSSSLGYRKLRPSCLRDSTFSLVEMPACYLSPSGGFQSLSECFLSVNLSSLPHEGIDSK